MANEFMAGQHATAASLMAIFADLIANYGATNSVSASQSVGTANTFVDLATVGPQVTLGSNGSIAVIFYQAQMDPSADGTRLDVTVTVSGATTISAGTMAGAGWVVQQSNAQLATGMGFIVVAITPGSNTYKMQYRDQGTTGTFANRAIWVLAP